MAASFGYSSLGQSGMKDRQKIIEYDSPDKREQRERMMKYERELKVQLASSMMTNLSREHSEKEG
jgi:hypothetical protein